MTPASRLACMGSCGFARRAPASLVAAGEACGARRFGVAVPAVTYPDPAYVMGCERAARPDDPLG
jgi:hypothetical protein